MKKYTPHNPIKKFWLRVDKQSNEACWVWKGYCLPNGYGRLRWNKRLEYAHRIAYLLTYGELPGEKEVCHKCDNPSCCNPKHLFLGTHQENMQDRETKQRGVRYRGENSPHAKLTATQVIEMRRMYAASERTQESIAELFGISCGHVHRILTRKKWASI